MRRLGPSVVLVSLLLVAAACGPGSGGSDADVPAPTITDAWVRAPVSAELPGAGYLTITSTADVDDWLIAATSPIAADIELHETTTGADGTTAMQPVDRIEVPAGGSVALEPGGFHLMMLGLTETPAVGDTVELLLTFQEGGEVTVQAEVRAG